MIQIEQFDGYAKKFRSLFDMHNIQFGSPDDFHVFMQKLRADRHFAMDFWALTGSLSRREGGELSVDELLAVIVTSVAGGEIPANDEGHQSFVSELASLLAGVDLYSPSRQSEADIVSPSVHPPAHVDSQNRFANMTRRAADEIPLTGSPAPPVIVADTGNSEPVQATSSVTAVQHQLDEALMRLELNSLELKEHLDDLDKKMSRIEPHLEALASKVYSAKQTNISAEEPVLERPVHRSAENPRLVLESREESIADKQSDPPIPIPLGGYSQRSGHRGVMLFVIILLLIAGGVALQQHYGSSLWQRYGATVQQKYGALSQKMHGTDTNQEPAPKAIGSSPVTAAATIQHTSVNSPATPAAPVYPASTARRIYPSKQTMMASSAPPIDREQSKPHFSRKTKHSESAETAETTATDQPISSTEEANAVKVAPAVMEANLVASRVPVYPEVAKAEHIEGPVVVQAIISKYGFVDRVHVVEGNPRLRNAAAEAIHKWHYRPYLLNGQPVEVATTITVDFKLDQ